MKSPSFRFNAGDEMERTSRTGYTWLPPRFAIRFPAGSVFLTFTRERKKGHERLVLGASRCFLRDSFRQCVGEDAANRTEYFAGSFRSYRFRMQPEVVSRQEIRRAQHRNQFESLINSIAVRDKLFLRTVM
ncbi:hypothetical protein PUN28_009535 [Cardiocondyla obscurior]|uniref:Uncharacterized protein n=1 Tax=Cardiocondyla obscurior TaxID=286306 RepID=A0AAW2FUA5_9HYME